VGPTAGGEPIPRIFGSFTMQRILFDESKKLLREGLQEPNRTATGRHSYTTRSLVTRVSVTTWLAAAKLGRLVLSQFVRCEH